MEANNDGQDVEKQVTFAEMRSRIEEEIDNYIFKEFQKKAYDSKEA